MVQEFDCQQDDSESPLFRTWGQYEKTLVKLSSKGRQNVYATSDAGLFFNRTVAEDGLNISLWKNIAGIFTGLGILGTFIGLTFGLSGINPAGTEEIQKGIKDMLGGMNGAFITSIAGILCAILSNFVSSYFLTRTGAAVELIAEKLNSLFAMKSAEQLLSEITDENRKQTYELQTFNSDLAIKIGDVFTECIESSLPRFMEESIGPMLTRMTGSMKNIDETLHGLNRAIENLNSGGTTVIAEKIQESMGNEMKDFAAMLNAVPTLMKQTIDDAQRASQESNNMLQESAKTMLNGVAGQLNESVVKQQAALDETNNRMAELIIWFEGSSKTANNALLENAATTRKAVEESGAIMREQIQKLMTNMISGIDASLGKQNMAINQANDRIASLISGMETNSRVANFQQGMSIQMR